ncbi:hypothetical protein NE237_006674 [Protea cynaroides]|uniref:Uncharacterized protein n=1 Tax=Protea cynaroides TaxID=273540 RepID=A0A9Q0QVN8_9MAGN|nr:hypothetical protein NE237_006674 [Protea cynaroides]
MVELGATEETGDVPTKESMLPKIMKLDAFYKTRDVPTGDDMVELSATDEAAQPIDEDTNIMVAGNETKSTVVRKVTKNKKGAKDRSAPKFAPRGRLIMDDSVMVNPSLATKFASGSILPIDAQAIEDLSNGVLKERLHMYNTLGMVERRAEVELLFAEQLQSVITMLAEADRVRTKAEEAKEARGEMVVALDRVEVLGTKATIQSREGGECKGRLDYRAYSHQDDNRNQVQTPSRGQEGASWCSAAFVAHGR